MLTKRRLLPTKLHPVKNFAQVVMRSMDPPGLLDKAGFKITEFSNWILFSSTTPRMRRWRLGSAYAVKGLPQLFKVFLSLLDQIKDFYLLAFLCLHFHNVSSDLLRGLIFFQGFGAISSLSGMALTVQTSKAIVNLDHMREPVRKAIVRLLLLLATPLMPVIIALRIVKVQVAQEALVANWRIHPTRSFDF